jgi:hypothetical protein
VRDRASDRVNEALADQDEVNLDKLAKMSAVRFSDDGDPEIGQTVYDLHRRKTQLYPEWAVRIDELFGADV